MLRLLSTGAALLSIATFFTLGSASAATYTWEGDFSGQNWNAKQNWGNAGPPNAVGDTVNFGSATGYDPVINAASRIGYFNINSSTAYSFTSSSLLTFDVTSGTAGITVNGAATHTFSGVGGIRWNDSVDIDIGSGSTFSISSAIQSATLSTAFTKTGSGTLTLTGDNTFTGLMVVNAGTLSVDENASFGNAANDLSLNGGILNTTGSFTAGSGRTITVGSSGGTIDVNSGTTFALGANDALRGTGAFTKTGSGTLTLGFANNTSGTGFSGDFTLDDGQVNLNAANALGQVNQVTVTSGTLLLGASQTIRDAATVNVGSSGTVSLNGNNETIATLSMTGGSVTTGSGTLTVTGGVTGNASASSATIAGNVNLGSSLKTFTIANGAAATDMNVSAVLSGTGAALNKAGAGTMRVSATNIYTGGTVVDGGVLVMGDRQSLGTGALTINNDAEVEANFGNSTVSTVGNITVNSGSIRRTANNNLPSSFLTSGSTTLTINGNTSLIDAGGDSTGGYLGIYGGITINSGTLTLNAVSANDEVRLGGTQNINIGAGATLATTGSGTTTFEASSTRYIVGTGTAANSDSTFRIDSTTTAASNLRLKVNGSGLGGLRIEGSNSRVSSFLTPQRLGSLSGTGGTLTIARNDSGDMIVDSSPLIPSTIKLGFDATAGSPIYILGSSDNDLQNFGGLVIKGGTVSMGANQKFLGDNSNPTTLDITGGTLELAAGVDQTTLEFTGTITLSGGTIDGGGAGGTKGILKTSGSVVSDGTTILYNPNLTMSPNSGTTTLSGNTPLIGSASLGDFEKTGAGTVRVDLQVSANTISINQGTLLLGGSDKLEGSMTLAGGTFATGGFNETLGTLTLANNSYIDLGNSSSIVQFADTSSITWTGGDLTIQNWSGLNTGGGTDQLYFGTTHDGLTANQVAQIKFLNPAGYDRGIYDAMILPSGEVVPIPVPVPEPKTVAAFSLIGLVICYRERKWLSGILRKICKSQRIEN